MPVPLKLRIVEQSRVFEYDLPARLELGRQAPLANSNALEPGPFSLVSQADGSKRLVVAWNPESTVASQFVRLEPLPSGLVLITNLSRRMGLEVSDLHDPLPCGASAEVKPPFEFTLDDPASRDPRSGGKLSGGSPVKRVVSVQAKRADPVGPRTLVGRSIAPGGLALVPERPTFPRIETAQFHQVIDWLQVTAGVLQSVVGSDDFLAQAATALVTIVRLHSGRVLRRRGESWEPTHVHRADEKGGLADLSDSVLRKLVEERRAVWMRPAEDGPAESLRGLQVVVAAPLLDSAGEIVGALYGEAPRDGSVTTEEEGKLLAVLVEMLASTVSAGLARQRIQEERTLLRQFFPSDLADRLLHEPALIQVGRAAEVTVLFCDVRGFSAASEKLGPARSFEWISWVMGELSACIEKERGVLVDYIGDELFAMWGAPEEQFDHAGRGSRAARAMILTCESLNARSMKDFGVPTRVGVGVNSGSAQVGNTGSKYKFKYGPMGDTVNIGSRIQGMTKYLKCPLLVAQETQKATKDAIARRVVLVQLTGVQQPRDLYELADPASGKATFFGESEAALDALEHRRFAEAAEQAGKLLRDHPGDGPLQLILSRASQALLTDGVGFDPVWGSPGK